MLNKRLRVRETAVYVVDVETDNPDDPDALEEAYCATVDVVRDCHHVADRVIETVTPLADDAPLPDDRPPPASASRIEVVAYRDWDGPTTHYVFVDGQATDAVTIVDVDPGAGHLVSQ